ncbi:cytochrome c550 [Bacillus songklensis]|uniref:Cytochrome c550 n=1 Tax=Bacillus songklensis TaxID=1069116 RepID=A0ABV8AZF1_9BACI
MNRNPLAPFFLIMAVGLILMLVLAVNGVNNAKEIAAEKEGGGAKQEAAAKPEDVYKQTCIGCHGDQYQGGVGPSLKGVGDRLSKDQIKEVITKGRGAMPANLVPEDKADEMAEWLGTLK